MPGLAFFDLDRTLLSVSSAPLLFRRARREGRLGRGQAIASSFVFVLYSLGLRGVDDLFAAAARHVRGQRPEELEAWNRRFWEEEVRGTVRPGALRAVAEHQRRGDRTILITSSNEFLARAAADDLGLDGVLATRMLVEQGRLTGACERPICAGAGKLAHAARAAAEAGVPLARCTFYTDSYLDLPLLDRVGHPVAVDPDPRLRRHAVRRGWPIVDWGRA